MRTAFQGAVAQTLPLYDLILLLKVARDGACLTSSSRLFQSLGPRKDIALCPLLVFRKGIERSVSVFLSSLTFRVDLFLNKLERYSGTRPFSDLYTVVAVSPLMMSLTVGHFELCIKPIEGVSKLLFVTILAARFCNFCTTYLYVLRTCTYYVLVRTTYLYVLRTCTYYVLVRTTYYVDS